MAGLFWMNKHPKVLHKVLNAIQASKLFKVGTPYFINIGYKAKPWAYKGNYNLMSIIY
jgi:hypothetical protein